MATMKIHNSASHDYIGWTQQALPPSTLHICVTTAAEVQTVSPLPEIMHSVAVQ